jgi:ribosomal protein S18 acetylase RimI-like enzyme
MEIRTMTDGDVAAVARLYLDAYRAEWTEAGARGYVEKFYRFEPERCLVVVEDGRIAGAALGYSFEREYGLILYLQELMVHPDSRDKGYGKALVAALRDSLTRAPSRVKVTPLVKADTTVLNFYNSLGFERDKAVSFSLDID